jgi:hypothetical protein
MFTLAENLLHQLEQNYVNVQQENSDLRKDSTDMSKRMRENGWTRLSFSFCCTPRRTWTSLLRFSRLHNPSLAHTPEPPSGEKYEKMREDHDKAIAGARDKERIIEGAQSPSHSLPAPLTACPLALPASFSMPAPLMLACSATNCFNLDCRAR